MKILIEEKDETQQYRVVPIDQYVQMAHCFKDRIEVFIPNLCGGETRITVFRSSFPDGNKENVERLNTHE